MVKVGQKILLKGKSRHGKNRIQQHGSIWTVKRVGKFLGDDAFMCESENETSSLLPVSGLKMNAGCGLKDDPNFYFSSQEYYMYWLEVAMPRRRINDMGTSVFSN